MQNPAESFPVLTEKAATFIRSLIGCRIPQDQFMYYNNNHENFLPFDNDGSMKATIVVLKPSTISTEGGPAGHSVLAACEILFGPEIYRACLESERLKMIELSGRLIVKYNEVRRTLAIDRDSMVNQIRKDGYTETPFCRALDRLDKAYEKAIISLGETQRDLYMLT